MQEAGGGKIINMASVAGISPPDDGIYSISKAAIMMTKVLAVELAADNIRSTPSKGCQDPL